MLYFIANYNTNLCQCFELCPNCDGALKRTDTNSWAHVMCALFIPKCRDVQRTHNVSPTIGVCPFESSITIWAQFTTLAKIGIMVSF